MKEELLKEAAALLAECNLHLLSCEKWAEKLDQFSLGFKVATWIDKYQKIPQRCENAAHFGGTTENGKCPGCGATITDVTN